MLTLFCFSIQDVSVRRLIILSSKVFFFFNIYVIYQLFHRQYFKRQRDFEYYIRKKNINIEHIMY